MGDGTRSQDSVPVPSLSFVKECAEVLLQKSVCTFDLTVTPWGVGRRLHFRYAEDTTEFVHGGVFEFGSHV